MRLMAAPTLARQLWLTTPMLRGDDVLRLQTRLLATGQAAAGQADGIFGRATRQAVIDFQQANGLEADGIVGAATWTRLFDGADGTSTAAIGIPDSNWTDILTDEELKRQREVHGYYQDGCKWQLGPEGIVIVGAEKPAPSSEREMVQRCRRDFEQAIATATMKFPVPAELIIACMCTESGGKPTARRLEPGCDTTNPERTPSRVSFGLMQTLLSTAREVLKDPNLRLDDLLLPEVSIRAGAGYMWRQGRQTKFDVPLVAAAYNAGGVYYNGSPNNRWRVRQYPLNTSHHVDRFVRFFNAALADAKGTPYGAIPNFAARLRS
jgi:putative peptidoglycan binding protein/transglycosylase-like protein with SLT domain